MKLQDLQDFSVIKSKGISAAEKIDSDTQNYIFDCLFRFYAGDYGEVSPDDTAANNEDLAAGAGELFARYKSQKNYKGDYIIIRAYLDTPGKISISFSEEYTIKTN